MNEIILGDWAMASRLKLLLTASVFAAVAAPALAQTAAPAASTGVQEIIVTAQRRSENLQNVPIAVTSFSATALATQHIISTLDIGRVVPNMFASNNVGQASANVYFIRGLGQTQSFPTFEPQVGTYVDDVYIGRQNANNMSLFGVDQIQVVRGPQGTLFGRNSTGGAILVTLQKPAQTFGGSLEVGYGSFGRVFGQGSIDLPINDQIKTRTAFFGITDDGFVKDVTTGQTLNATHDYGVRESVTIKPAGMSNVEWDLAADYSNNNAANVLNQPGPGGVNGADRIAFSGLSTQGGVLEPFLTGDKAKLGQGVDVQSWGAVSNVKVAFGAGTLDFITGFRGLKQALDVDFPDTGLGPANPFDLGPTGQFALAQELRSSQYSQEVKWSGDIGDRFKYTTGVFFLYETNLDSYGAVGNLGAFYGPPASIPFPLGDEFTRNDTSSEAVYAQGDYKITDALTLTVGGRFTHELKTLSAEPNAPGLGFTTAQIQAAGYKTHLTAEEFTPRFALEYKIDPDLMVFASATKGFQGGGWNGLAFSAATFNDFKPETVWSYETGFRYRTPDHKLTFNTTLFYEDVKDYQLLSDNVAAANFVTTNAASLGAYGAEFELTWRPIQHLTLSGNAGLINAFYYDPSAGIRSQQALCAAAPGPLNGSCGSGIVNPTGQLAMPSNTAPVTLAGSVSYDAVFSSFVLTPSIGVQWTAREEVDTAGNPAGVDKAHTLFDAGVTYKQSGQPWSVTAECKNCSMQNYGTAYLFGYKYYNTPGTWDVKLKYKF
jgi:iron complex outermembrane receptor protein